MARAETSEKSAAAFRTISEAADTIGVPQHVLRFWETRFPQLQPLKRGGNRRYYRPADMALLETIRSMLHDRGLTIRGARLALAETGDAVAVPPRAPARILRAVTTDTPGVEAQHPDTPVAPEPVRPAASLRAPVDLAPLRIIRDRLARALAA